MLAQTHQLVLVLLQKDDDQQRTIRDQQDQLDRLASEPAPLSDTSIPAPLSETSVTNLPAAVDGVIIPVVVIGKTQTQLSSLRFVVSRLYNKSRDVQTWEA